MGVCVRACNSARPLYLEPNMVIVCFMWVCFEIG